jgi:hypothetical protein
MRRLMMIGMAAMLVAGAAVARDSDARRDLAKALAGHVPGKTSECIDPQFADGPQVIGHDTLLYRQGSTIWKTNVIGPCPALDDDVTVIADIYGGQLCRNDKFRVLEHGMTIPSAYCRLGSFQQYLPVRKQARAPAG